MGNHEHNLEHQLARWIAESKDASSEAQRWSKAVQGSQNVEQIRGQIEERYRRMPPAQRRACDDVMSLFLRMIQTYTT